MRRQLLSTLSCPGGIFMDAQWIKGSLRLIPQLYRSGTHQWVTFMTQTQPLEAPLLRPRLRTPLPTQPLIPLLLAVSGYCP